MVFDYLKLKFRALSYAYRRIIYYPFFRTIKIAIGKNLSIRGGKGIHSFGDNMVIYDNVVIESHNPNGQIIFGADCILSYGVIISCTEKIIIGNDVWIGEYASIRDSTHSFSIHTSLKSSKDKIEPITIGNNVWIGRNTLIMPGASIGNNVVIGANSIVKGKCEDNCMYAGTPAVLKKYLTDEQT
jgi:acetyltransferase-like isoleucine patch superfamily enzyme